jgi:glycosyltransferase involved in cell wall biosynthesis
MQKPLVLVIAAMPPPVHGQSAVTASIVNILRQSPCKTILADTSPESLERSFSYHGIRLRKLAVALSQLVGASFQPSKRIYTVVESGAGIAYNFLAIFLARLLGYQIFLHHHTARHLARKSNLVGLLTLLAGANATHIVLSDYMAADLRTRYPAVKRTRTLHNARNIECFSCVQGPENDRLRLGLLANLSDEKGLSVAIATCRAAVSSGLHVKLVLAGPAADQSSRITIDRICRDTDLFEYWGPVHGDAKRRFFESLDVFLFPTQYPHEAQPLVTLEAMASGIPIIANNRGYIGELMGDCGLVVPNGVDYTQAAIEQLKKWNADRSLLRTEGARGRARFDQLIRLSQRQFHALLATMGARPAPLGGDNAQT